MSNFTYIGIDVGKAELCCSLPGTKPFMISNDAAGIKSLLKKALVLDSPGNLCFVMESTSVYSSRTAEIILDLAETWTAIVPPICINGFKQAGLVKTKNDFVDALAIREFAEAKHPNPWLPRAEAQRRLRNLQVVMGNLVQAGARLKNVREKLANEYRRDEFSLTSTGRMIGQIETELATIQAEIDRVIAAEESLASISANILSIPGIGLRVHNVVMSVILEQLLTFSQRKLLNHCGMSPREHISGKYKGRTLMSKSGDPRVRGVLYMAALVSIREQGLLHDYYLRQKEAGKPSKVAIVNVMRRLLYIIQGVVKSGAPFDMEVFLSNN